MRIHLDFTAVATLVLTAVATSGSWSQVVKEDRQVDPFSRIDVGGAFHVIIEQADRQSVVVESDQKYMDQIITKVQGSELRIEQRGNINNPSVLKVMIQLENLEGIEVNGAAEVSNRKVIKGQGLEIRVNGAGNVDLLYEGENLDIRLSGAGNVTVEGMVTEQRVRITGAGNYQAYDLKSKVADIESSGAGNGKVTVSERIDARARGAGNILYQGDPEKVYVSATGAGNVKPR